MIKKKPFKMVVIGNLAGSVLTYLIRAIRTQQLNGEIVAVICTNSEDPLCKIAEENHLHTEIVVLPPPSQSINFYDAELANKTSQCNPDLILLISYGRILSKHFVEKWPGRILNIHGSLLPKYAGFRTDATQAAVLAAGDKIAGCTVHIVTEEVDMGPIITQSTVPVTPDDTPTSLRQKVIAIAGPTYVKAIKIMEKRMGW